MGSPFFTPEENRCHKNSGAPLSDAFAFLFCNRNEFQGFLLAKGDVSACLKHRSARSFPKRIKPHHSKI